MTVTFADILKKELCDHLEITTVRWQEAYPYFYETRVCKDCNTHFKLTRYKGFPVKYDIIK